MELLIVTKKANHLISQFNLLEALLLHAYSLAPEPERTLFGVEIHSNRKLNEYTNIILLY